MEEEEEEERFLPKVDAGSDNSRLSHLQPVALEQGPDLFCAQNNTISQYRYVNTPSHNCQAVRMN